MPGIYVFSFLNTTRTYKLTLPNFEPVGENQQKFVFHFAYDFSLHSKRLRILASFSFRDRDCIPRRNSEKGYVYILGIVKRDLVALGSANVKLSKLLCAVVCPKQLSLSSQSGSVMDDGSRHHGKMFGSLPPPTLKFRQQSCSEWERFRSSMERLGESSLSKTLISPSQISCPSSVADRRRGLGTRTASPSKSTTYQSNTHRLMGGHTQVEVMSLSESEDLRPLLSPQYQGGLKRKDLKPVVLKSHPNTHL